MVLFFQNYAAYGRRSMTTVSRVHDYHRGLTRISIAGACRHLMQVVVHILLQSGGYEKIITWAVPGK
jgi:hypothetical protein